MNNKILKEMKLSLSFLFILFLSLSLFSCTSEPELPTAEEAKAAVWEKIQYANDKWEAGDPTGFMDIVAEDVIWVDDLGAMIPINGKEALVKYIEPYIGQIPPHTKELLNPMFQFFGEIVIVNYRYLGTFDGVAGTPWKITSVFRYADGDWLSVHENWSEVEPPPQAPSE